MEHKQEVSPGFFKKYGCKKLIYFEHFYYIDQAIAREKQLKNWNRKKKEELIKTLNPKWNDLTSELL